MRPRLELLETSLVERILSEAIELLDGLGCRVQEPEAVELLASSGARVDGQVARIPERLIRQALATVPREFSVYDRAGVPAVRYAGEAVHFDPGSSAVNILDPQTRRHRPAVASDLVRLVQVAELIPQYAAQSTAVVCSDVPQGIGDLYRLFLVLLYSAKPVVTGAFAAATLPHMINLLVIEAGERSRQTSQPRAVFDVCPTPPLTWTEFSARNLIDLARAEIPAEIVSMPLAGATAPVTLAGSLVQHAAECLSGIVIHQLAMPGSPVVWGGAPAIFDMRKGSTPMGAIETAMIDVAYAQIGKSLGLPTHAYLGASDAKVVDAQAGYESGISAVLGALAGINMISGAGMLDFLAAQSAEKLVLDAEAIGMGLRLVEGIQARTDTLATGMFATAGLRGDFLKLRETRALFKKEQRLPSEVIDRGSLRAWQEQGSPEAFARAQTRVADLVNGYRRPPLSSEAEGALCEAVIALGRPLGMEGLPGAPEEIQARLRS